MKTKDNDSILDETFQSERNKIPVFMRLSKVSMGIAIGLEALGVITLIVGCNVLKERGSGIFDGFVNMTEFFSFALLVAVPMLIVIMWFILCYMMEKRAYRKASEYAAAHARWQEEQVARNYHKFLDEYHEPEDKQPEPVYCSNCGLLLIPGEKVCSCCGEPVNKA